jgi:hypothetical protein
LDGTAFGWSSEFCGISEFEWSSGFWWRSALALRFDRAWNSALAVGAPITSAAEAATESTALNAALEALLHPKPRFV